MRFLNSEHPLTGDMIAQCEKACGLVLPAPARELYARSNGGEPDPYVFQNDELDTVVSEFLPLAAESRGTAVQSYRRLVTEKAVVAARFFPFAIDGGGDYFFVDTQTRDGAVYFYRSDSRFDQGLLPLGLDFTGFWAALVAE
ncbi:SMI1/KNR4 family protein [Mesorhizobium sp. B4-1-1]|nr:SMI1/KNR4 family protein [Mesorhizobium sp. B4-1-1]